MTSAIALKPCIFVPVPHAASARAFDAPLLIFSREQRIRPTVAATEHVGSGLYARFSVWQSSIPNPIPKAKSLSQSVEWTAVPAMPLGDSSFAVYSP